MTEKGENLSRLARAATVLLVLSLAGCTSSTGEFRLERQSLWVTSEIPVAEWETTTEAPPPEQENWVRLDGSTGTPYGTDYTCLLANQSWFSANRLPVPATKEDADKYRSEGAVKTESALYPWRTVNNLGTESSWVVVPGTCESRTVSVQAAGELGEEFVEHLLTPEGQTQMAEAGLAYPLTGPVPADVERIAPKPE